MSNTVAAMFGDVQPRSGEWYGLEFEVESVRNTNTDCFKTPLNSIKEDNSLRNHGQEVVTAPITFAQTLIAHDEVFFGKGMIYFKREEICSPRGSIHVHVNFADALEETVKQFIRLYAVMEPYFFDAVDSHRHNNIYCVPLFSTHMLSNLVVLSLPKLCLNWHKYTAFNIKCLSQFGTIEFRHLQCTMDKDIFARWMGMIHRLYEFNNTHLVRENLSPTFVTELVSIVLGKEVSLAEVSLKLEQQLVNDTLIWLNPSKQLLLKRLQEIKNTSKGTNPCAV